jgi:hypothetical protein
MTQLVVRVVVMLAGLVTTAYGGLLLAQRGWQNFEAALTWLVAGVLLHDAVLAPLTVVAAWAALRVAGPARVRPWAVAVVLLGPLTLLAVPVLGRFGARADNPTLLDRSYWTGWSVLVAVVGAGILVAEVVRRRRTSLAEEGGARGPGDGRR